MTTPRRLRLIYGLIVGLFVCSLGSLRAIVLLHRGLLLIRRLVRITRVSTGSCSLGNSSICLDRESGPSKKGISNREGERKVNERHRREKKESKNKVQ